MEEYDEWKKGINYKKEIKEHNAQQRANDAAEITSRKQGSQQYTKYIYRNNIGIGKAETV